MLGKPRQKIALFLRSARSTESSMTQLILVIIPSQLPGVLGLRKRIPIIRSLHNAWERQNTKKDEVSLDIQPHGLRHNPIQ